jgi:hypothetical protein
VWSDFPGGPLGLVGVYDDVGEIGPADCVEVVLLGRQVAVAEALLDPGGGSQRREVTDAGASQVSSNAADTKMRRSHRSISSGAQEEHAVEEKHSVGGRRRDRPTRLPRLSPRNDGMSLGDSGCQRSLTSAIAPTLTCIDRLCDPLGDHDRRRVQRH